MKIIVNMSRPVRFKGGPGSGNHGHSGRPGKVGGSGSKGGSGDYGDGVAPVGMEDGPGGGRSDYSAGAQVNDKARSMLDEMISEHPMASIDDAQDFVYQVADKLLKPGDDIPESWFEMLDELYSDING